MSANGLPGNVLRVERWDIELKIARIQLSDQFFATTATREDTSTPSARRKRMNQGKGMGGISLVLVFTLFSQRKPLLSIPLQVCYVSYLMMRMI